MILYSLLSRRTSGKNLIPEIEGFRFFAIFTVILYHFNTHFSRVFGGSLASETLLGKLFSLIIHQGSVGVDVFFAISGFILALPFAKEKLLHQPAMDLKNYYFRRVTRLEPPYVITLVIFFFVIVFVFNEAVGELLPNFLASLFYVHNIVYDSWSVINPVAWSLEVEVQFYIIAPFIARSIFGIKRSLKRRAVLIFLIVLCVLNYNFNYEVIEYLHLRKSLFMHLHQFLVGFLFADFFLTDWREKLSKRNFLWDIVGIAMFVLLFFTNTPFDLVRDFVFEVALFIAFICLFKGKLLNRFFSNKWIVIVGGMCYSIYLLHYALLAFLINKLKVFFINDLTYKINFFIGFLIAIPIVLVICSVFFVIVERPCMDRGWPYKVRLWFKMVFRYSS